MTNRKVRSVMNGLLSMFGSTLKLVSFRETEPKHGVREWIVRIMGERLTKLLFGEVVFPLFNQQQALLKVWIHDIT